MMLHIYGHCSFGQDYFEKLHFENILFDPATNKTRLNNFGMGHPGIIPVEFGQIFISGY